MHCHGGAKLKSSCRTVQVLPECLRLSKVPAVHCSIAIPLGQPGNPEKTPLSRRVGQPDSLWSEKEEHDPCAQSLLLTGAPGCPTESATGSRQCNSLQCLVHGSGRLEPTPPTKQDRHASRTRRQGSQDNQKVNKRKQEQTNLQMWREAGRHCGGCVCVKLGPAVLSSP